VVEWAGDYYGGDSATPVTGMGLSFLDIDPADRIAITRFLTRRYAAAHAAVRIRTSLPARVGDEGNWLNGSVREIGERTLFIETTAMAPVGAEIDILIRFPNFRAPVAARGVVLEVASGDAPRDGGERRPGAGAGPTPEGASGLLIELREVSPRGRDVMNVFLDEVKEDSAPPADA
jgi:hypothetical protein